MFSASPRNNKTPRQSPRTARTARTVQTSRVGRTAPTSSLFPPIDYNHSNGTHLFPPSHGGELDSEDIDQLVGSLQSELSFEEDIRKCQVLYNNTVLYTRFKPLPDQYRTAVLCNVLHMMAHLVTRFSSMLRPITQQLFQGIFDGYASNIESQAKLFLPYSAENKSVPVTPARPNNNNIRMEDADALNENRTSVTVDGDMDIDAFMAEGSGRGRGEEEAAGGETNGGGGGEGGESRSASSVPYFVLVRRLRRVRQHLQQDLEDSRRKRAVLLANSSSNKTVFSDISFRWQTSILYVAFSQWHDNVVRIRAQRCGLRSMTHRSDMSMHDLKAVWLRWKYQVAKSHRDAAVEKFVQLGESKKKCLSDKEEVQAKISQDLKVKLELEAELRQLAETKAHPEATLLSLGKEIKEARANPVIAITVRSLQLVVLALQEVKKTLLSLSLKGWQDPTYVLREFTDLAELGSAYSPNDAKNKSENEANQENGDDGEEVSGDVGVETSSSYLDRSTFEWAQNRALELAEARTTFAEMHDVKILILWFTHQLKKSRLRAQNMNAMFQRRHKGKENSSGSTSHTASGNNNNNNSSNSGVVSDTHDVTHFHSDEEEEEVLLKHSLAAEDDEEKAAAVGDLASSLNSSFSTVPPSHGKTSPRGISPREKGEKGKKEGSKLGLVGRKGWSLVKSKLLPQEETTMVNTNLQGLASAAMKVVGVARNRENIRKTFQYLAQEVEVLCFGSSVADSDAYIRLFSEISPASTKIGEMIHVDTEKRAECMLKMLQNLNPDIASMLVPEYVVHAASHQDLNAAMVAYLMIDYPTLPCAGLWTDLHVSKGSKTTSQRTTRDADDVDGTHHPPTFLVSMAEFLSSVAINAPNSKIKEKVNVKEMARALSVDYDVDLGIAWNKRVVVEPLVLPGSPSAANARQQQQEKEQQETKETEQADPQKISKEDGLVSADDAKGVRDLFPEVLEIDDSIHKIEAIIGAIQEAGVSANYPLANLLSINDKNGDVLFRPLSYYETSSSSSSSSPSSTISRRTSSAKKTDPVTTSASASSNPSPSQDDAAGRTLDALCSETAIAGIVTRISSVMKAVKQVSEDMVQRDQLYLHLRQRMSCFLVEVLAARAKGTPLLIPDFQKEKFIKQCTLFFTDDEHLAPHMVELLTKKEKLIEKEEDSNSNNNNDGDSSPPSTPASGLLTLEQETDYIREFLHIRELMQEHFKDLQAIFAYYSDTSKRIQAVQFWNFIRDCRLVGKGLNHSTVQHILEWAISTKRATGVQVDSGVSLDMASFVDILIHLAHSRSVSSTEKALYVDHLTAKAHQRNETLAGKEGGVDGGAGGEEESGGSNSKNRSINLLSGTTFGIAFKRNKMTLAGRFGCLLFSKVLPGAIRLDKESFELQLTKQNVNKIYQKHQRPLQEIFLHYSRLKSKKQATSKSRPLEWGDSMAVTEFCLFVKDLGVLTHTTGLSLEEAQALFFNVQGAHSDTTTTASSILSAVNEEGGGGGQSQQTHHHEMNYPGFLEALAAISMYVYPNPYINVDDKVRDFFLHHLLPWAQQTHHIK